MTTDRGSTQALRAITIHLLDSGHGHPVQAWQFKQAEVLRIGRGVDTHVTVVDPSVSRLHAELAFADGSWKLFSRGRNGVFVNGQLIDELVARHAMVFRLGVAGPALQILHADAAHHNQSTIQFDGLPLDFLEFDAAKTDREIQELTGGKDWESLKRQAERLKQIREAAEGTS